ncbi:hypothetical protein [Zooshikella sp. RANM57]|uniref:hypothetical protein n=1 Tax=Zooshikella sp. RANM57 TaxID=3425863 RepID=UPI003D6F98A1
MPVTQSEKENIAYILQNGLGVNIPARMVNDAVVRATEEALVALDRCANKSHALGTMLELVPKGPTTPVGWLLSANKTMAMRHQISTNPEAKQSSLLCMAGMSTHKRNIEGAALSPM